MNQDAKPKKQDYGIGMLEFQAIWANEIKVSNETK